MFTGIIQHVGEVRAARAVGAGRRLTIDLGPLAEGLALGDSVAVAGACLTACAIRDGLAEFDLAAETVARTTLGEARPGTKVNLERALRADGALDGHIVQGHVDGVATARGVRQAPDQWAVAFECPAALSDEMVPKGSVALDGVSLTLTAVGEGSFSVALIPTTLERTTLSALAPGMRVNVETDILGKYVRRYLRALGLPPPGRPDRPDEESRGLTLEKLRRAGFA